MNKIKAMPSWIVKNSQVLGNNIFLVSNQCKSWRLERNM